MYMFYEGNFEASKSSIPFKTVTVRVNDKPWYNAYLHKLRRKCKRKFSLLKIYRNEHTCKEYKDIQKVYQHELICVKTEYENTK